MIPRPTHLAVLLLLVACAEPPPPAVVAALVQPAPDPPTDSPVARSAGETRARMPRTLNHPLGLAPMSGAALRPEPAPVPDRAIEAPRDRLAGSRNPTLEPMLLPQERNQGLTFGREHLRDTGPDRPFDTIVPGARLRIPFE